MVKKSLKKLLTFLVILILLSGVYITLRLISAFQLDHVGSTASSEQSVLVLPREQIQSVRVLEHGQELTFIRTDNHWQIRGYNYPLSSVVINAMIGNLTDFQARPLAQAQSDLSVYGLGIPQKTVEISLKNGEKSLLLFGNKTPLGTHYYMQVHGKKEIFLATSAKWDLFAVRPHQYWDVSLPQIDWHNIAHMRLSDPSSVLIELNYRVSSPMFMHYEFVHPRAYRGYFANSTTFYRLWQDWSQNPPQKQNVEINVHNWATYGLQPPQFSFVVYDKQGNKLDMDIGSRHAQGDYYARLRDQDDVFTLSKNYVQNLLALKPFALLNKFVALIPKDEVSFFIFTTPSQTFWGKITDIRQAYKIDFFTWYMSLFHYRRVPHESLEEHQRFRHEHNYGEIQYYFNGLPVEDENFLSAYQRMVSLSYEAEVRLPRQVPQMMYQLVYYNHQRELITEIDFLSYNAQYYLVRIDGCQTPFLVGSYQLEELTQTFERL